MSDAQSKRSARAKAATAVPERSCMHARTAGTYMLKMNRWIYIADCPSRPDLKQSRITNRIPCKWSQNNFTKLVWPTFGGVPELVQDMSLLQAFGLLWSLSEFARSSLRPCCSRGLPTNLHALATPMKSTKLVWPSFGRLPELVQDIFLLQASSVSQGHSFSKTGKSDSHHSLHKDEWFNYCLNQKSLLEVGLIM